MTSLCRGATDLQRAAQCYVIVHLSSYSLTFTVTECVTEQYCPCPRFMPRLVYVATPLFWTFNNEQQELQSLRRHHCQITVTVNNPVCTAQLIIWLQTQRRERRRWFALVPKHPVSLCCSSIDILLSFPASFSTVITSLAYKTLSQNYDRCIVVNTVTVSLVVMGWVE